MSSSAITSGTHWPGVGIMEGVPLVFMMAWKRARGPPGKPAQSPQQHQGLQRTGLQMLQGGKGKRKTPNIDRDKRRQEQPQRHQRALASRSLAVDPKKVAIRR